MDSNLIWFIKPEHLILDNRVSNATEYEYVRYKIKTLLFYNIFNLYVYLDLYLIQWNIIIVAYF